jgi:L-lactate dehydrogenase (cytochrome)
MGLSDCHNISDLRVLAKKRLPIAMFDYIDGGADDEVSLANNTDAFERYSLVPDTLIDVSNIRLKTKVLGTELDLPFFLSPTGMSRLFHHGKENAVARAAATHGTLYSLSTLATTSMEDIAAETSGPKMFQIYILKDRELTKEFVTRAKAAKYKALCLTVDTPFAGNRERDLVNGMQMPPKFSLASLVSFATHPAWAWHTITRPNFKMANVAHRVDALGKGAMGLMDYVNSQFDRTVGWDDVAWLIDQWDGPFVIKGISSIGDAKRAQEIGASAIMISNHGGRQLDGAPAPVDLVGPMRDAVGDKMELIVDGGIRRGSHVLKALALGANACSVGRSYLYGLAAGGEAGVDRALGLLTEEVRRTLGLMGCAAIKDVTQRHIEARG